MGIGHLFLSSLFFKVGVGLKITHSERLLPPSLTSFHFWKMSRGSRHIKKAHHLQPFLLLFTIKNWHYSSVPKMKISTSLTSFYIACCHNYCLNGITYSNGDLMLILIEWQVLLLKPFMWWAFCQIWSTKLRSGKIWQLLLWLLSLLVPHSFCSEVVKRERHVIFESILGPKNSINCCRWFLLLACQRLVKEHL